MGRRDNKMVRTLKAEPLTAEAFAPYGDVIATLDHENQFTINYGNTTRYHDMMKVDVADEGGSPCVNIFRSHPLSQPIIIKLMERHPLGSQSFLPLGCENPYLVVVAEAGELDLQKIRVFLAQPNQGVNYHKGVWHHFSLALGKTTDFLVIDRKGGGENLEEYELPHAAQIVIQI